MEKVAHAILSSTKETGQVPLDQYVRSLVLEGLTPEQGASVTNAYIELFQSKYGSSS